MSCGTCLVGLAASEANPAADVGGGGTVRAQGGDGAGVVAFGQPRAGVVADQAVVMVGGGRQVQQGLQQDVDHRGVKEILAADHVGDTLRGIIHNHREVVGARKIAARQDDVADLAGKIAVVGGDAAVIAQGACAVFVKGERGGGGAGDVEAKRGALRAGAGAGAPRQVPG